MALSATHQVWNRAALEGGGPAPREGDKALNALLLFHGMGMNGGLAHAIEVLNEVEFRAAVEGYRFFRLDELADFLKSISDLPEEDLEERDGEYYEFVPDDSFLDEKFQAYFRKDPESFAPLS